MKHVYSYSYYCGDLHVQKQSDGKQNTILICTAMKKTE